MGLVDSLRMSNIFNPGADSGFKNNGINLDEISGLLNRVYPLISQEKEKDRQHEKDMFKMHLDRNNPVQNIGNRMSQNNAPIPSDAGGPETKFDMASYDKGPSQQFADNILNPPERSIKYITEADKHKQAVNSLAEKSREFDNKQSTNQQNADTRSYEADIRNKRANVYDYKTKNPDHKLLKTNDGHIYGYNPKTDEMNDLGYSEMSQEDLLGVKAGQRMDQIKAQGEQNRETESQKGESRLGEIAARAAGQKSVKASPSAISNLPTQNRVDQFNRARELYNTDSDLRQYIKIGEGNTFTIDENTPLDKWNRINEKVFGNKTSGGGGGNDPLGLRKKQNDDE